MTPDQFSTDAVAWITAIAKVLGVALATFIPLFIYVRNEVGKLKARDDDQQKTIDANKDAIVDIHATVEQHAAIDLTQASDRPSPLPPALAPAQPQTPFDGQKVKV